MDAQRLALEYLNFSHRNVYLTGKAGTGKTTFLRKLADYCQKPFIVIAPTGVAALNAGGVTIHSQFLFPLGSYLPEGSANQYAHLAFFDRASLNRRHPLNAARKKVLQGIDLLVIDEVSMCRADILDAIDQRLRQARNTPKPFGGVQLLMIGDLYQLPPIVKDEDWAVLQAYYQGMHFFHSKALQSSGFVQVELQKVYRQQDELFINLLNKIRQQQISSADLDFLNQAQHKPIPNTAIHLLTHRHQAEAINSERLEALAGKMFSYPAAVQGDFPERMYPVPEDLNLKVGARVMFLKNDSEEGAYYNGKIAEVVALDEESIWVQMEDFDRYKVPKDTWKNSRYKVDEEEQSLKEEVLGQFSHFPLRLAWAITIHKSQGLSFDEAVINLGKAFAPGQAYVALTRLRSLEGLYLSAPLQLSALITDHQAQSFSREQAEIDSSSFLEGAKEEYRQEFCTSSFDLNPLVYAYKEFYQGEYQKLQVEKTGFKSRFEELQRKIDLEQKHAQKFQYQIAQLIAVKRWQDLGLRLEKAVGYFEPELAQLCIELQALKLEYAQLPRTKQLVQAFEVPVKAAFEAYLNMKTFLEAWSFFEGDFEDSPAAVKSKSRTKAWEDLLEKVPEPKTPKQKKKSKGETFKISYDMFRQGMQASAIASARELTIGTIYSHALKGLQNEELEIGQILSAERIQEMEKRFDPSMEYTPYQWHLRHTDILSGEWQLFLWEYQKRNPSADEA